MQKAIAVPVHKLPVYLQPFYRSSFFECALQLKIAKINKNLILEVQGRSKSLIVDTTKKLATSAYCDRQHVHAYLQPVSQKTGQQR